MAGSGVGDVVVETVVGTDGVGVVVVVGRGGRKESECLGGKVRYLRMHSAHPSSATCDLSQSCCEMNHLTSIRIVTIVTIESANSAVDS